MKFGLSKTILKLVRAKSTTKPASSFPTTELPKSKKSWRSTSYEEEEEPYFISGSEEEDEDDEEEDEEDDEDAIEVTLTPTKVPSPKSKRGKKKAKKAGESSKKKKKEEEEGSKKPAAAAAAKEEVVFTRKFKKSELQNTLNPSEVLEKEEEQVCRLVETFCVPRDVAWAVCERLAWRSEKIQDYFLEASSAPACDKPSGSCSCCDVEGSTAEEEQEEEEQEELTCAVCAFAVPRNQTLKLSLCPEEHRFCRDCWKGFATALVRDGKIPIPCMSPRCTNQLADVAVLASLLDREVLDLYRYLNASNFISKSNRTRWCPAASCNRAIWLDDELDLDTDVRCACGTPFCVACGNEWHAPVDCETYRKWCDKCTSEGESTKWIATFTRPCPNAVCQKPIEKNGGCPHMHVSPLLSPFFSFLS